MSIRTAALVAVPALAVISTACKPPVEAPEDLGQASRFAFQHFDTEGGEEVVAAVLDTIEPHILGIEDLSGNSADRTVAPPPLLPDHWGTITGNADADPQEQVPVAVAGESIHGIAAHVGLVAEPNYVCVESDTTVYAQRTFTTDVACFVDGSCDKVETVQETRKESALADVWYDWNKDYRTFELEDGRQLMVGRGWVDQAWTTDGGNGSWDQSYTLDIWLQDGDRTLRYVSNWSSVTLSTVNDGIWASLVESGTVEAGENADAFLTDGFPDCKNDRDETFERPE